jgi:hypothetical protein
MEETEETTLAEIIRRCVEETTPRKRNDACTRLREWIEPIARDVWGLRGWPPGCVDEFVAWVWSWLFMGRIDRLLITIRCWCFQEGCDAHERIHVPTREADVRNYLYCMVHTARLRFESERGGTHAAHNNVTYEPEDQNPFEEVIDQAENVREIAKRLENENDRIPFWLRYIRVCGKLLPDDLATLTGRDPDAAEIINQRYAAAHASGCMWPFDAATIADLVGITPQAVDAAVYRALREIRRRLGVRLFKLTKRHLNCLGKAGVSVSVLQRLECLVGRRFPSQQSFEQALSRVLSVEEQSNWQVTILAQAEMCKNSVKRQMEDACNPEGRDV